MTVLQDKMNAIKSDTSISSKVRAWIYEATSRIERSHDAEATLSARIDAAEARLDALEKEPSPSPPPPVIPPPVTPPPVTPPPATGPAAPIGPFVTKDGGGTQDSYVFDYNPAGHVYEKLSVKNYLSYGIGAMCWPAKDISPALVTVRDCIIDNVSAKVPQSRDGTAEACLWIGNKAVVQRVKLTRGAWMGMWTGAACFGSVFEDIEISDCPGTGLYIEHDTKNCTFRNCKISAVGNGVNIEWWYDGHGSNSITFDNCEFHSDNGWGLFADAGTYDLTIKNCKFTGKNGIALPRNLADPSKPNKLDLASCDFTGVTGIKSDTHANAIG